MVTMALWMPPQMLGTYHLAFSRVSTNVWYLSVFIEVGGGVVVLAEVNSINCRLELWVL